MTLVDIGGSEYLEILEPERKFIRSWIHKVWSTFRKAGPQFPPNFQVLVRHSYGAMRTREYLLLVSI
jgi:hypothetical protein